MFILRKLDNLKDHTNATFSESRDIDGNLNYLSGEKKIKAIEECEVIDLSDNKLKKIREIYNFDKRV